MMTCEAASNAAAARKGQACGGQDSCSRAGMAAAPRTLTRAVVSICSFGSS
jgi:hypothetical protein